MPRPRIDGAKIDVEGGELPILAAYLKATDASAWPSLLILERADLGDRDAPDAAAYALSKGYNIAARTRMNVVLTR